MGLLVALLPGRLAAQGRGGGDGWAERVIVVVPMTGKGTYADPRRPDFGAVEAKDMALSGWQFQTSDDGKYAIVLLSATQVGQSQGITSKAAKAHPTVFERGRHSKDEIEKELRKLRKDFSLEALLGIPVPSAEVAK